MSLSAIERRNQPGIFVHFHRDSLALQLLVAGAIALFISLIFDWAILWPEQWVLPIKAWITEIFRWLDKDATFGLFTVKQFTRTISWVLKQPLIWSEQLLWRGAKPFEFLPIMWILISIAVGIFAMRIRGLIFASILVGAILAIVVIDSAPFILQSLSKALKIDPWMEPRAFIGISQIPAIGLDAILTSSKLKHIPWIAIVLGFGVLGHWVGGIRLALIVTLCMAYLAVTGLWRESMKTFSLVVVAVPFSAIVGLWLGVWVTRSKRAASIITPIFDVMQATPHLAYLVPVVVMFGVGQVPALIATVIFAMPPMARCTILAIQTVPSDIVEAGRMSGCTPRQLLWKVELPASQKTLLMGLNQVIMQTLAMVVICSLVGAQGLGHKLLFSLQQLKLGFATMQGIAIVLMAVVLDRITQTYAQRSTVYAHHLEVGFFKKHIHLIIFFTIFASAIIGSIFLRDVSILSKKMLLVDSKDALELDKVIKGVTFAMIDYIRPIRDFITVYMLIPIRDFYHSIPWLVVAAGIGVLAYRLGGRSLAVLCLCLMFAIIVVVGNWLLQ